MFRSAILSIFVVGLVAVANAGQIEIGGVNGLTNAYITAPNTVAGQNTTGCAGGGTCVSGNLGTVTAATEQNYNNVLFSGALNGATAPVPYAGYSTSTANTGTITDAAANGGSGVTFAMINDGTTSNASNNVWALSAVASGSTANVMTIPVGVLGVSDVWMMLNTELGTASASGLRDATIVFNFGTASNSAPTAADTVTVKLTNTNDALGTSGQLQNAVACSPVTGACDGISAPASGSPAASTTLNNTTTGGSGGSLAVKVDNVFTASFNSLNGYPSASGNVVLNDEGFIFNNIALASGYTNLNTYLVSIQIQEPDLAHNSPLPADALSAITVDTASAVPEPSTVFLLIAGLGAIGMAKLKRSRA